MNKLTLAVLLFLLMLTLSVFMHQRNGLREVYFEGIRWDENRPQLIAQDSVNKLLKVVLSDSTSAFKSGLNLSVIEQTLNHNAWVESAQSFVSIDGGMGVHITSKIPIVRIEGDSSYYLDAGGAPFPLSYNHTVEVPIFYGNPTENQRFLLAEVVQITAQDPFMADHVVAYEWLPEGLTAEPRQEKYQIVLGAPNLLELKFNKYKAFYAKMQDSAVLKTYKQVNLSFHGQVVCSK